MLGMSETTLELLHKNASFLSTACNMESSMGRYTSHWVRVFVCVLYHPESCYMLSVSVQVCVQFGQLVSLLSIIIIIIITG